jgi:hypothetical protein
LLRQGGDKTVNFIAKYKIYNPITQNISNIEKLDMHHKHVFDEKAQASTLNYDTFVKHDTVIIKSCTGTGKTTAVARHAKRYIEQNPKTKLLTITTRTTLSDQHQLSFSETNMKHYKTTKGPLHREKSLTICINSLRKINLLEASGLNDYIVYIDEVASFLELTHNETIDATLKETFYYVANIVKHAKKVIVSDALINDNVFYFLRRRPPAKTIFVENSFNKVQNLFVSSLLCLCYFFHYCYFLPVLLLHPFPQPASLHQIP